MSIKNLKLFFVFFAPLMNKQVRCAERLVSNFFNCIKSLDVVSVCCNDGANDMLHALTSFNSKAL